MTRLWCWRCRRVVPMLDEHEWAVVDPLLTAGLESIKAERARRGVGLREVDIPAAYRDASDAFERLTGERETDPERIRHHRTALYGPPCGSCGRPLRTPRATRCGACGRRRS